MLMTRSERLDTMAKTVPRAVRLVLALVSAALFGFQVASYIHGQAPDVADLLCCTWLLLMGLFYVVPHHPTRGILFASSMACALLFLVLKIVRVFHAGI
jgi:uncharacterized MAPEG superfamily protein